MRPKPSLHLQLQWESRDVFVEACPVQLECSGAQKVYSSGTDVWHVHTGKYRIIWLNSAWKLVDGPLSLISMPWTSTLVIAALTNLWGFFFLLFLQFSFSSLWYSHSPLTMERNCDLWPCAQIPRVVRLCKTPNGNRTCGISVISGCSDHTFWII